MKGLKGIKGVEGIRGIKGVKRITGLNRVREVKSFPICIESYTEIEIIFHGPMIEDGHQVILPMNYKIVIVHRHRQDGLSFVL